MLNRRQVIKSAAAAATVLAMPRYARAASGFTGFYPAANWIPAKQAMIQIYPRPDAETNTWARHHWAYYDGVNPVQYKIPLGVSFGAFPYVFQLLSGPPGMTIGATYWQSGWSFAQAAAAGYGYLLWTPTASVSGATVSILVTDQQMNTLTITFTVSTSSSTSRFIFIDAVKGSDSAGTGAISAPWKTFSKAFGTSYSTTNNQGAICYFRAGTYSLPNSYSGNLNSFFAPFFELDTSLKPAALIGFPGDSKPVFDLTVSTFATVTGSDLFMQNLAPNGYNASQNSVRFVLIGDAGTPTSRTTFDGNVWTNSGYGASAGSNATGYFFDTTSAVSQYHFLNGCSETNRQSGNAGNNYGGCSFYSVQNVLVQGNSIIDPTLTIDEAWQPKSNVTNGCWRGNTTIVASCQYAYSPLQSVTDNPGVMQNVEICYNILVGGGGIAVPITPNTGQHYGALWCYRNTVQGGTSISGLECSGQGYGGPYTFENNAVQANSALPSSSGVTTSANLYKGSGLIDTSTGYLTSSYSSYLGTVGAQIALNSSVLTPKAPSLSVS